MEQVVSWREHFKISSGDLSDALVSGQISEAEYFKWAKETFQLPIVNEKFFAIPEDPIYWESISHAFKWNRNLFPLTEWDGVVLIGCLEPPVDFHFRQEHRFVLVSPQHLHALWGKLNSEDLHQPAPEAKSTPVAKSAIEMPAGLDIPMPLAEEEQEASASAAESVDAAEAPLDIPEGMLPLADLGVKIPPIPKSVAGQKPDTLSNVTPESTAKPIEETAVRPPPLPPRAIEDCKTLEEVSAQVFNQVLKNFKSAMFLICEKDRIVPWKWTQALDSPANASVAQISIQEPSIFRIALHSRMPFHGGIRPSEENNRVFAAFGDGKLPVHATVVPIMAEGKIFALLMGINDSPMEYRFVLPPLEKLAAEVGVQALKLRGSAQAA